MRKEHITKNEKYSVKEHTRRQTTPRVLSLCAFLKRSIAVSDRNASKYEAG
jgi:hypothetical protein